MNKFSVLCCSALITVASTSSYARVVTVPYDHYGTNQDKSEEIKVKNGDPIDVTISNTCAKVFSYKIKAVEKTKTDDGADRPRVEPYTAPACSAGDIQALIDDRSDVCTANSTITVSARHEDKFGGYVVQIRRKDKNVLVTALTEAGKNDLAQKYISAFNPPAGATDGDAECTQERERAFETALEQVTEKKVLKDVDILLSARKQGWDYEFAGAFTISELVDPKYAVVPDPNDASVMPQNILVRDRNAENSANLGFAGFIHMTHANFEHWAPLSFGLGITDSNDVNFFAGTSWRLSDKAYVTFGVSWTSVDSLPAGEIEGTLPSNDNVLSNLGSRTDNGAFLSFSYTFLNPGNSFFNKPFAVPDSSGQQ